MFTGATAFWPRTHFFSELWQGRFWGPFDRERAWCLFNGFPEHGTEILAWRFQPEKAVRFIRQRETLSVKRHLLVPSFVWYKVNLGTSDWKIMSLAEPLLSTVLLMNPQFRGKRFAGNWQMPEVDLGSFCILPVTQSEAKKRIHIL